MEEMQTNPNLARRGFIAVLFAALFGAFGWYEFLYKPIARAAPFVKPMIKWNADNFHDFVKILPDKERLELKKSLGLLDKNADTSQLKGGDEDALEVQKQALWLSSNIFAYPFRDETRLNYHEDLVTWVCKKAGVSASLIASASSFRLERELTKMLFAQLWDKLDEQQRRALLSKIDPNGNIQDKGAVAALSGAAALGILSTTVAFSGFAFYTTMSVTISTVAGFMGVTLPFATYMGASSLVGILSGPVGWAIMAVSALGGLALAGRANVQKTTALICQLHALKVEALLAAGTPEKDVFS